MNIPYWLAKYLPLFDYICPKCREEVKKNSHACVHCGEHYGAPLRVPPKVLKDRKALEHYVHDKVFPRVSRFERAYLSRFFTVDFSDTFASGSFSAWTALTTSGSGTGTVQTSNAFGGAAYSAEFTGSAASDAAYVYKNSGVTFENIMYLRAYFYFSSLNVPSGGYLRLMMLSNGSYNEIAEILNSGGTLYWALEISQTSSSTYTSSVTPAAGAWYCVEMLRDITDGIQELWINGVSVLSESQSITTVPSRVTVGLYVQSGVGSNVFYVDYVVLGDAYNGPLTSQVSASDLGTGADAAGLSALLSLSDLGFDSGGNNVVYDGSNSSFWSAINQGSGSVAATASSQSGIVQCSVAAMQCVVASGAYQSVGLGHVYSPTVNWGAPDRIGFWFYGSGNGAVIALVIYTNTGTPYYLGIFVDSVAGWQWMQFHFTQGYSDSMTIGGTPDLTQVEAIGFSVGQMENFVVGPVILLQPGESASVSFPVGDLGSGVESSSVGLPVVDVASGLDMFSLFAAVPVVESGSGTDSVQGQATIPIAESGIGSDSVTPTASVPALDAGAGSDLLSIGAAVPLSESASGTESLQAQAAIPANDAASGSEIFAGQATITVTDSGVTADAASLQTLIALLENASGSELASLALQVAESGLALDAVHLAALVSALETGLGAEATEVNAVLALFDSAAGVDVVMISQLFSRSVTLRGNGVAVVLRSDGAPVNLQ